MSNLLRSTDELCMGGRYYAPDGSDLPLVIGEPKVEPIEGKIDRIWNVVEAAVTSVFNHLNMLGSILLAYALANPNAFAEVKSMLPESVQPYAPLLALLWFFVVQLAKMSAIKKAQQG